MEAQGLTVEHISAAEACRGLAGIERHDPHGRMTVASVLALAERGSCMRVTSGQVCAVIVLRSFDDCLWISAVMGHGNAVIHAIDELLTRRARFDGKGALAFKTARRGLVKKCKAIGWRERELVPGGWIMEKVIR